MTTFSPSLDQLSLPAAVSRAAECTPNHPAVLQDGACLTYEALNRRANQVAHYLLSQGAAPESKIGIAMGRSAEFVIAALGILKSGAAYVPLDPSYPQARRSLIANDAGLLLSLCGEAQEEALPGPFLSMSLDAPEIRTQDTSEPELPPIAPETLAYIIYTSGSTGVPKGVEVTHGNLQHLVAWHHQAFRITSGDRSTLLANVGFDAAVWELWPYLSAGATLLIPAPEVVRQPGELRNYIVENQVSILFAPTLLAEALLQTEWPRETRLRYLLTGGDTLRVWPPAGLPFSLVNNYGPAECTVVSTSGKVLRADVRSGIPSIGHPIQEVQVCLLDEHLREVPPGSPGEICIGGSGVARGYRNLPELTAERFVVRERDGLRLYRSGDLGCIHADGSLQFLGRMDGQVKIRGYRIECGEIEAALNSLPAVQTSAVVVREQRDGHRSLAAYVVPRGETSLTHEELRQGVRSLLPEYMVPELFVRVDRMPLNENGKIDRNNLPEPTESTIVANAALPASPVESDLREILTELLGVDRMDREDDFFLLGGHSFIAAQLIARIRDRFGVELSLRTVFEHPTLAGMAEQIEQRVTIQQ